jgi:hypothetical protein
MSSVGAVYEIASNGAMGEPQTIFARQSMAPTGRDDEPELVVVSGPLWMPAVRAQAIHFAAQQSARVLKIAVMHLPDGDVGAVMNSDQLHEIKQVFDSVFTVDQSACADLVRRLVHAIVTPGDPIQVVGCDWNDVRDIVAGAADDCVAGYGFGHSAGPERAASAVAAALGQLSRQGFNLAKARGVCIAISAARENFLGREVKEVISHIRRQIGDATAIAQCIEFDESMGDATMEVDIFAFGANGA